MKRILGIILILIVLIFGKGIISENTRVELSTGIEEIEMEVGEEVEADKLLETVQVEETETEIAIEEPIEDNINEISISLVGDILLDGHIRNHIHKEGYDYPWHYVREYFENDDITIGNLETSITGAGEKWPDKQFNFRSEAKNVGAMKDAGIDVVSLANNHSLDYGYEGFRDTLRYLNEGDIKVVGAGENIEQAIKEVIIDKDNMKIGILGFSRVVPDVGWWATPNRPGLVGAYDTQMPQALKAIENLKKEVDILIVSVHWGKELEEEPRQEEIIVAKKMIDSGADVIAGHHPHVLQGIEIYKGRPIFYSLGNFVFGTKSELTANTMIAQLDFNNKDLKAIEIIPFNIVNSRPRSVDEEVRQEKLQYLRKISNSFNTIIDKDGKIIIEEYQ